MRRRDRSGSRRAAGSVFHLRKAKAMICIYCGKPAGELEEHEECIEHALEPE
jgi:hypothetical protein